MKKWQKAWYSILLRRVPESGHKTHLYFLSRILVYGDTYFQEGCSFFSDVLYPDSKICGYWRKGECVLGTVFATDDFSTVFTSSLQLPPVHYPEHTGTKPGKPGKPGGSAWHACSMEIFGGKNRNCKQAGKLSSFLFFPSIFPIFTGNIIQEAANRQALKNIGGEAGKGKKKVN